MFTFWYIDMPNITAGYKKFSDLMLFLGIFMLEASQLHQTFTDCVLRQKCRNER